MNKKLLGLLVMMGAMSCSVHALISFRRLFFEVPGTIQVGVKTAITFDEQVRKINTLMKEVKASSGEEKAQKLAELVMASFLLEERANEAFKQLAKILNIFAVDILAELPYVKKTGGVLTTLTEKVAKVTDTIDNANALIKQAVMQLLGKPVPEEVKEAAGLEVGFPREQGPIIEEIEEESVLPAKPFSDVKIEEL